MVQVIDRPSPTFGEQVARGLHSAAEKAPSFGQLFSEQALKAQYQRAQRARTLAGLEEAQSIYNNPNLSEEDKILGVYQQLADNPALAKALTGSMGNISEQRKEDVAGSQFAKGYDAILKNNLEDLQSVIDSDETPLSTKLKLTDLRNQMNLRKDVEARELRNRQNLVSRSYDRAIAAEQQNLKVSPYGKRKAIEEKIKKLEALKKSDLHILTKNPDKYPSLKLWNYLDSEFVEDEGDDVDVFEKVQFDPKNPQHIARRDEVLMSVGGDRQKANLILAEEFKK